MYRQPLLMSSKEHSQCKFPRDGITSRSFGRMQLKHTQVGGSLPPMKRSMVEITCPIPCDNKQPTACKTRNKTNLPTMRGTFFPG